MRGIIREATHTYAEKYLNDAMENLGESFNYAVNACSLGIDEFMEIIEKSGKQISFPEPPTKYACSPECRCGRILAYYHNIAPPCRYAKNTLPRGNALDIPTKKSYDTKKTKVNAK